MPRLHDLLLVALGGATAAALAHRAGPLDLVTIEAAAATLLFAGVALRARNEPLRIGAAFAFVCWFYFAVARIVPAIGMPVQDPVLRAVDEALFGAVPAAWIEPIPWLTDLMSACYLTYHLYLGGAVIHAMTLPAERSFPLPAILLTAFAVGTAGYLLVPAIGPAAAFPELFSTPLSGGPFTQANAWLVATGSSVYDVFPSLHTLMICLLLHHDWRRMRVRFWVMIVPSIGLIASTIYLRYHYAADVLAGLLLFGVLAWCFRKPLRG